MQAFGIEIRKANKSNLFNDVDMILLRNGIPSGGVSRDVQTQTVAHALQKMIKPDHWLDICCIKECANICSVCIPAERMAVYHACHCIHWNEMLPNYRQTIIAMILDDFREILNS